MLKEIFGYLNKNKILVLFTAFYFLLLIYSWDEIWFNRHASRDLSRGFAWAQLSPENMGGPEIDNNFSRLPGPAYYWLLAPFLALGGLNILLLFKAVFVSFCFAYFISRLSRRNPRLKILVAGFILTSPILIFHNRLLWNPSLVFSFNCLILALIDKFEENRNAYILAIIFLLTAIGIQIHFSTIQVFVGISLAIFFDRNSSKREKRIQFSLVGLMLLYVGIWRLSLTSRRAASNLNSFFTREVSFADRLNDLVGFFSFDIDAQGDYNPFVFYARFLHSHIGLDLNMVRSFSMFCCWIFFLAAVFGLTRLFMKNFRAEGVLVRSGSLHFLISALIIVFFGRFDAVPTRYSLALFPSGFLLSAIFLDFLLSYRKAFFSPAIKFLMVISFVGLCAFNFSIFYASHASYRGLNEADDSLDLNLRTAMSVVKMLQQNRSGDPFEQLHGRVANRLRQSEYSADMVTPYYSIFRFVHGTFPTGFSDVGENLPTKGLLLKLNNEATDLNNFLVTSVIDVDQQPTDVQFFYYSLGKVIRSEKWTNSSMILPLLHLPTSPNATMVEIRFQINCSSPCYLNVLAFDQPLFNKLETKSLKIDDVLIEGQAFSGGSHMQTHRYYQLSRGRHSFALEMNIRSAFPNAERIDIYTTREPPTNDRYFK